MSSVREAAATTSTLAAAAAAAAPHTQVPRDPQASIAGAAARGAAVLLRQQPSSFGVPPQQLPRHQLAETSGAAAAPCQPSPQPADRTQDKHTATIPAEPNATAGASTSRDAGALVRAQPVAEGVPAPASAAQNEAAEAAAAVDAEAAVAANVADDPAVVADGDDGADADDEADDAASLSSAAASSLPDVAESEADDAASVSSAASSSLPDLSDGGSESMSISSDGSVSMRSDPDSDFVIDLVSSEDEAHSSSANSSSAEMVLPATESEDYDLS